ncbi:MAG: hypothetical protein ACI9SE_001939 [Neolewinella sp.]
MNLAAVAKACLDRGHCGKPDAQGQRCRSQIHLASSPVRPDKFGWLGMRHDAPAIVLEPAAPHSLTRSLMITTDGS